MRSLAAHAARSEGITAAEALIAAGLAVAAHGHVLGWQTADIAFGIVACSIIGWRLTRLARILRHKTPFSHAALLAAGWITLLFSSNIKFSTGRTTESVLSGRLSPENLTELVLYLLVGMASLLSLGRSRGVIADAAALLTRTPFVLLLLLSAAWSAIPRFSSVRALQLLVVLTLAVAHMRVIRVDRQSAVVAGHLAVRAAMYVVVRLAMLLLITGSATGGPLNGGRWTWPGTDAGNAAYILGAAAVAAVAVGTAFFDDSSAIVSTARPLLLLTALAATRERTSFAAGALILVAVLGARVWDNRSVRRRYLSGLAVVVVFAGLTAAPLSHLFLRTGEAHKLGYIIRTLDGRTVVWQVVIDRVTRGLHLLYGFGYGAARIVLPSAVRWGGGVAGTAHNAYLELLYSVGMAGPILFLFTLVRAAVDWWRNRATPSAAANLAAALLAYTAILSVVSDVAVYPGFAFTALTACLATLSVSCSRRGGVSFPVAVRKTTTVRSAAT